MNAQNDPQNPLRDQIQIQPQEALDTAGEPVPMDVDGSGNLPESICDDGSIAIYDSNGPLDERPYGGGWPGDGSGMDDLADFNANEAMDYCGE